MVTGNSIGITAIIGLSIILIRYVMLTINIDGAF